MVEILDRVTYFVALLFSLTVHEWAHARSALALGDDTAAQQGRCTLSPFPHIDLLGTVILPLLNVPFGWAKPVPVNPLRFRRGVNMRMGMMLTAAAGPLANLGLAAVCTVMFWASVRVLPLIGLSVPELGYLLRAVVLVNVMLACFNLVPVPPLDGSRVADYYMPAALRPAWERVYASGPIALLVLVVVSQTVGLPFISYPVKMVHEFLLLIAAR